MRILTNKIKTLINQSTIQTFMLVDMGPFKNGSNTSLHYTTLPYSIELPIDDSRFYSATGNVVYSHEHQLIALDPPRLSKVIDREAFKISFADPNFALRSIIGTGVTGSNLRVRVGFVNNSGETLDGVAPNELCTDIADLVTIYSGVVDAQLHSIDTTGETTLAIEGSSPMGALGLTRSLITSKEWLNQEYPSDTSFDQAFIGSRGFVAKWGKNS